MRVIQIPEKSGERVIALGMFDGVHRGHQSLLQTAKETANDIGVPLRVCTFNRHPLEILRPEKKPEMLSTIPERAGRMSRLCVDEMELLEFNKNTADMAPEAFLEKLRNMNDVKAIVAGWNYTFGFKGSGNAELLKEDGAKYGYKVIIVPPTTMDDGTAISSSLVRRMLQEGDVEKAADLLGYRYTITGTVSQGKHEGRRIGFPTANIEPWKRKALPMYGVYTCLLETEQEMLPAVVNIGVQPTIPSGKVTVEAHALQESPELYGRKVRLTLLKMMRKEKKFSSPEELKKQIQMDKEEALRAFDMA